jgi:hypothetical protein
VESGDGAGRDAVVACGKSLRVDPSMSLTENKNSQTLGRNRQPAEHTS